MLRASFNQALKDAMRTKDQRSLSTVRLILAAIKDRDIAARGSGNMDGISDDEIMQLLQKMIKQRDESTKLYEQAGRLELAEQEQEEVGVIERFLPKQLSEEEIKSAVDRAIAEIDAKSAKDMGKLMALLGQRYAGQMDFGRASAIAKSRFG